MRSIYLCIIFLLLQFSCNKESPIIQSKSESENNTIFSTILEIHPNVSGIDNPIVFRVLSNKSTVIFQINYNESSHQEIKVNDFSPWFIDNDREPYLLETFKYLDYLNHSFGYYDIDLDGSDEFFYVFSDASDYGLILYDYINGKYSKIGEFHGFVGFYPIKNTNYIVSNFIRVGPDIRTTKTNSYISFLLLNNNIEKLTSLPTELYEVLYDRITQGHITNSNFYEVFFFLYNNNPKELTTDFIDSYFVSDPDADNNLISTDNVEKLFKDEFSDIPYEIFNSKYYYYYLLKTLK